MVENQKLIDLRHKVISTCELWNGTGEDPPGSNRGELPDAANNYVGNKLGSPYCAAGLCFNLYTAGCLHAPRTGSSGGIVQWGKLHNAIREGLPFFGDLFIILDPNSPTGFKHSTMIVGGVPGIYRTFEFNEGNHDGYNLRHADEGVIVNPYVLEDNNPNRNP